MTQTPSVQGCYGYRVSIHAWCCVVRKSSSLSTENRFGDEPAEMVGLMECRCGEPIICCHCVRSASLSSIMSELCRWILSQILLGTLRHPKFCPFRGFSFVSCTCTMTYNVHMWSPSESPSQQANQHPCFHFCNGFGTLLVKIKTLFRACATSLTTCWRVLDSV